MKIQAVLAIVLVSAAVVAAVAQTQSQAPPQTQTQPRPQAQVIQPPGNTAVYGGGYYGGYHSSTAAGSAMNGMGNVVRAQGEANLNNSAAAVNYSAARTNEIQNYKDQTSAYFDMRALNKQARAAERGPRPSMDQLVRRAQEGLPKRLSPSELDVVTGQIHWPMVLQADMFAEDRAKLESIFASRTSRGAMDLDNYRQVRELTDTMLADLKKHVREVPAVQYLDSKNFLTSLAYEAGQPLG